MNKTRGKARFKFASFSTKQKQVLCWWLDGSPYKEKDAIICDGAVRSGKTLILGLSYIFWAMEEFNYSNFGMAGKTIGSFRRNVLLGLKVILRLRGYTVTEHRNENYLQINKRDSKSKVMKENYFYIFGGRDERSQDLVQGFTSAGFLFDEVALMPESFVSQAVARCSIEGRKFWFNCNPDGPFHWFKLNWIDLLEDKNGFRIHFNLEDNPSLSTKMIESYKRLFSGIFYERFILGLWTSAQGTIYSMFNKDMIIEDLPKLVKIERKWIGVDYGQSNATVFLLVGLGSDKRMYILDEYYHEGSKEYIQKSPSKYSKEYKKWKISNGVDGIEVNHEYTFIDPSALGFMLQLHEDGERKVRQADNTVLKGIQLLSSIIDNDMLRVLSKCKNTIKEFGSYKWCPKAQLLGEDKPIKQFDHAMDSLRYVANGTRRIWQTIISEKETKVRNKIVKAN